MQLNANGPGCKPQAAKCTHVLDSGEHVLGLRLSATLSGHVFRRAIRIEDVVFLVTAMFQASEPLTDTVILDLVDDVIDRHEGLVADVHLHTANRRHGINQHEHSKTIEAISSSTRSAPGRQYSEPHYEGDRTSETNPRHHRNCSQKSPNHNEALAFVRAAPTQVGAHHLAGLKADKMS